jgi:hypothetical protein
MCDINVFAFQYNELLVAIGKWTSEAESGDQVAFGVGCHEVFNFMPLIFFFKWISMSQGKHRSVSIVERLSLELPGAMANIQIVPYHRDVSLLHMKHRH